MTPQQQQNHPNASYKTIELSSHELETTPPREHYFHKIYLSLSQDHVYDIIYITPLKQYQNATYTCKLSNHLFNLTKCYCSWP